MKIKGNIVDILSKHTYGAELTITDRIITKIEATHCMEDCYMVPGFIDAHIHIESSMATPSAFAEMAVQHGTIGVVADPHEIANIVGVDGIDYMINDNKENPFYTWFGLPSSVPATPFETSGAIISAEQTADLMKRDDIHFLAEMMNVGGVINADKECTDKINASKKVGKPIDGHYPCGLGDSLSQYINCGISTDHEACTLEEGRERAEKGMYVQIREGSAGRNYEALHPLISEHPEFTMFCSDDIHPNTIYQRHINGAIKRSIALGYNIYDILRTASLNPAKHYNIPIGMLQVGDSADFVTVDNLNDFNIQSTYIKGDCVYDGTTSFIKRGKPANINNFKRTPITDNDLSVEQKEEKIRVICCTDGQLITQEELHTPKIINGCVASDVDQDILKLVVVNRYGNTPPSIGFFKGSGLKKGAVAQSIMHDSHNIIAIGVSDKDILKAINQVIHHKGGFVACHKEQMKTLALPIAGIMSPLSVAEISKTYVEIETYILELGSSLNSLQMTLSFMGLLVIPSIKLSDKGLFDGDRFSLIELFV